MENVVKINIHPIIQDIIDEVEKIYQEDFPGRSFKDVLDHRIASFIKDSKYVIDDYELDVFTYSNRKPWLKISLFSTTYEKYLIASRTLKIPNTKTIKELVAQYEQVKKVQDTLINGSKKDKSTVSQYPYTPKEAFIGITGEDRNIYIYPYSHGNNKH